MPGKHGGFFKRLKAKSQKDANKQRRGTMGMKKGDRVKKHNALVDLFAAQRRMRDLDQISTSSEELDSDAADSDDGASDASSVAQQDVAMGKLRAMLGVDKSRAAAKGGVDGDDESSDDDGDDDDAALALDADDLRSDSDDDGALEGGEEDEEEDGDGEGDEQFCSMCSADLSAADGVACTECKTVYCMECHEGAHADLGHRVISLADLDDDDDGGAAMDDLDDDEEEEEDDPEMEFDDEDDEEVDEEDDDDDDGSETQKQPLAAGDTADAYDPAANDPDTKEHAERRRAFLPAFEYTRNTQAAAAVEKAIGSGDPWLSLFVNSEPLAAPSSGKRRSKRLTQQQKSTDDDDRSPTDATESAPIAAIADPSEAGVGRTVSVTLTSSTARWAEAALSRPVVVAGLSGGGDAVETARPSFVLPFIWKKWVAYKQRVGADTLLSPEAWAKLNLLSTYSNTGVNTRTWDNEPSWMEAVVLHVLNHWAKSVSAVAVHDEILRQRRRAKKAAAGGDGDDEGDEEEVELRDRGFAKTRVMLVLPMRNMALKYLTLIHDVLGDRDSRAAERFSMFTKDFSELDAVIDKQFYRRKDDFRQQFDGNVNDSFCVGATLRASGMGIYTHVLNSDILVCSPLGLRKRVAKDADVLLSLASIEVAIVDQAHVLLQQNWEHFTELMGLVNRMPKDTTEGLMDLRRVYSWALEGRAGQHRQTVMISTVPHALLNGFLRSSCDAGHRGHATVALGNTPGVLPVITHNARQNFVRFPCKSPTDVDDARFEYFKNHVFPAKVKPLIDRNVHAILYIPSTFDFLRLRVFLDEQIRGSYAELTEHTSLKGQRKALGQFSALERPLLVMTERFYFYKRYFVKHAEALVFYSPPLFPDFYSAMVNQLTADSPNAAVLCPFCRFDALQLQGILGTSRAKATLTRPSDSYMFVSTNSRSLV